MYQFIHIETYARKASTKVKPSKPKTEKQAAAAAVRSANAGGGPKGMDAYVGTIQTPKTRATVSDVVGEALRDPEHCPHVENPEPPTFLVGDEATLRELPDEIKRNLAAYHAKYGGRKVRSDTHVLLAGVASYPRELEQTDPAAYDRWEKSTVKWLQEKYGDNLRCVMRHNDEAHPHIHFYVCDRELVNAKELHDGYKGAAAAIAEHGQLSKEARAAFNDSMRDFQSDYYKHVGHAAGLLRDGPKRLRETRVVYKAREREALERVALDSASENARVQLLDGASLEAKKAVELRRQLEREAGVLVVERVELKQLRDTVQSERDAVDGEWAKAREARAAAGRLETDAARQLSALDKQAVAMERAHVASVEAKAQADLATVDRDREADALRTEKARAVAFSKKFQGQLAGLGAVENVRALVRKPELVAMVEFIDQNPQVRALLDVLKAEPFLAQGLAEVVQANQTLQDPAVWEPPRQVSVAADFLKILEAMEKAKGQVQDSGMGLEDFSL